jgi:hypothetical protein
MSVAELEDEPRRTRRAILVGAFGGVAALLAGGLGRAKEARAAAGSPVIQGVNNNAGTSSTTLTSTSSGATLTVNNGIGTALRATATAHDAIAGFFTSYNGPGFSAVTANRYKYGAYFANDAALEGNGAALRVSGKQNIGAVVTTSGSGTYALIVGAVNQAIHASAEGTGIYALSRGDGAVYGVYGETLSPDGFGLYSQGDAHVNGTLSKSAGMFKIDHPLDPANKYLSHSFVESPDMLNVYSGTVVLSGDGEATVELPDWFDALNGDIRYQLTAVGSAAPDLHVKTRFDRGRFTIAGGHAGQEVSWQLTGIRRDAYAKEHPIVVEQLKKGADKGKYLHPELFGKPASKALHRLAPAPKPPTVQMPTLDWLAGE